MATSIHTMAGDGTLTESVLKKFLAEGGRVDDQDDNGFTPLSYAARNGRLSVVKLLIKTGGASANARNRNGSIPLYEALSGGTNRHNIIKELIPKTSPAEIEGLSTGKNCLIRAIKQQDADAVKLLIQHGASLEAKDATGKTARQYATESDSLEIQRAVLAPGEKKWVPELVNMLVSLVLFVLAYVDSGSLKGVARGTVSKLYHIGSLQPDPDIAKEIQHPQTVDEFLFDLGDYVKSSNLGQFFPDDDNYLTQVAERAIELKNDPRNKTGKPGDLRALTRLALYQPVFYCDDSGSMFGANSATDKGIRMDAQRALVKRMASIATRLVPDGTGAHLRFINSNNGGDNLTQQQQFDQKMPTEGQGGTNIGGSLHDKVLDPLIYEKLKSKTKLSRPFLIITVTDGCPDPENVDVFKNSIITCLKWLDSYQYPPESVKFLVSQVGDDKESTKFLDSLAGDAAVDQVLHRTAETLDSKYAALRDNEAGLEEWLTYGLSSL
ncbi:ankyrin repeat protein, partial [Metarhizium brunneum ARSEF 3297]